MPKKPPHNAYYYFMLDYKKREENLGRIFHNGMRDVAELASDEWKALPPEEKDYYTQLAKTHKNDPRPKVSSSKKFNTEGKSFQQLDREKMEKEQKISERKEFVKRFVNEMNADELKVRTFYLIHVNYFCKTDHNEYYAAELAISEFSLNGVQRICHLFINPGDLPTGYAAEVKDHSEKYHKIMLDNVKRSNGLHEAYITIRNFLTPKFNKKNFPPLFTMNDNVFDNTSISAVVNTLQRLWESDSNNFTGRGSWEDEFKVFPLHQFFFELKKKCIFHSASPEAMNFPNDVIAELELKKDTYHFSSEMACDFHREEDVIAYCSRSYVIRWAHIIRNHCCQYLDIEFILPKSYSDNCMKTSSRRQTPINESKFDEEFRSVKSSSSNTTYFSQKTTDFHSDSIAGGVKNSPQSQHSTETSWASAVSQMSKGPSTKSWATASQPKEAPPLDMDNFPSLKKESDRRPIPAIGRGRGMLLVDQMQKLNLKK